jgi:hypothetical protein
MRRTICLGFLMVLLFSVALSSGCVSQRKELGGIEGIVTDPEGNPLAELRVFIVSGTTSFPEIYAITNEEGRYAIGSVPQGKFEVAVYNTEGERIGLQRVAVREGRTSTLNFVVPNP